MQRYETADPGELLKKNAYPGRGIVVGTVPGGVEAAFAYFIMGRSANSRNRVFVRTNSGVKTAPFDETRVKDPSLIIYNAVHKIDRRIIIANGDHSDTVYDYLAAGRSFYDALSARSFEPDIPHLTSRITALMDTRGGFGYQMSLLKCGDSDGATCERHFFSYAALPGVGHMIHTYAGNGNPLPPFAGEPVRVAIPRDLSEFTSLIWQNLDDRNKIALCTGFVHLADGRIRLRIVNKLGK